MIGITLANEGYRELAFEASRRFKKHTGLSVLIADAEIKREDAFKMKLHLYRHSAQTIVLFDSDLWFIEDCDLSKFDDKVDFMACLDPGIVCQQSAPVIDAHKHGLHLDRYFNSGLMIFNQRHHHIFEQAYGYYQDPKVNVADFGEQSYLNMAVQRSGIAFKKLDSTYNYAPFAEFHKLKQETLNWPIAIHAMGYSGTTEDDIPAGKMRALNYYMTKYESGHDLT